MSQKIGLRIIASVFAILAQFLGDKIMAQELLPYKKQAIHGILDGDAEAVADAFEKNPDLISDENAGYQPWICHAVNEGNAAVVEAVIAAGCLALALAANPPSPPVTVDAEEVQYLYK